MKGTIISLMAVSAVAGLSTVLYILQGGFGAGHGRYDVAVFFLGLPWVFLMPDSAMGLYAFWLIGLPWLLNVLTVIIIAFLIRARRARRNRTRGFLGHA